MTQNNMKEVQFDKYCQKCAHVKVGENMDPCFSCLAEPFRENSRKPYGFEESKTKQVDHVSFINKVANRLRSQKNHINK